MTRDRDFKRIVRQRVAKTGESYSTARRQLEARAPALGASLRGWTITGPGDGSPDFRVTDYEGGLDPHTSRDGMPCAFLRSITPEPSSHVVIMQSISSRQYRGRRIRFSAWLRATGPEPQHAALWVRVVPLDRDSTLAYGRALATSEWQPGTVVLDVPEDSCSIMFGLMLHGRGHVWFSGADFEVVDDSVPVTAERQEPVEPVNLTFQA